MESDSCWPTTLEQRLALGYGWYTWCLSIKENPCPLSKQLSITNSFLARGGICVHFLFSVLEFCPAWTYTGLVHAVLLSMSLYVHRPWKTLFLGGHPPTLALPLFLPPLLHRSLSLERKGGLMKMFYLCLRVSNSLTICILFYESLY